MTTTMILALGVLIFMIVLIMTDALPFGAPPLLADVLILVLALYPEDADPFAYSFAGFTDKNVWLIAFFMVVLAAFQKTSTTGKIQDILYKLVNKGGFKSYVAIILVIMFFSSFVTGTGWYMLIISLLATIPYNEKLPTSKILMPGSFASVHALLPLNVAFYYGLTGTLLSSFNYDMSKVSTVPFMALTAIASLGYFLWSLVGYKLLPDHPIADQKTEESAAAVEKEPLPKGQAYLTIACILISIVAMMFLDKLGTIAYAVPALCAFVLLFGKVLDWKTFLGTLFSPIVLMMAGVLPVANALADSGFTGMIGGMVAGVAGGMSPFVLVLVFCTLIAVLHVITGASFGSLFVFAPVLISTCISLGIDPVGPTAAAVYSAWVGSFLPIDGQPAVTMGMGKYSMAEFWKYTIPMDIIGLVCLALAAVLCF